MQQEQSSSTQDVLLVGYGSGSRRITSAFADRGVRFIVVEKDQEVAAEARAEGLAVIEGDATDANVLRQARVDDVELVAVTAKPADEALVKAIRKSRPDGVILTHLSPGYEAGSNDATARMIVRMSRVLEVGGKEPH